MKETPQRPGQRFEIQVSRQFEQIGGLAQAWFVKPDRRRGETAPQPMDAPGGAGGRVPAGVGRKMLGVAQRGRILAMARQRGAGGGGAQRQALAQRPGEWRVLVQERRRAKRGWRRRKVLVWPKIPGLPAPPQGERLVPKIDVDGNETSGLRLPDQALPIASFTGWNAAKEKAPGPCTAGAAIPFPPSRAARSLLELYGARSYFAAALRSVADKLVKERLLLPQDADAYVAAGKQSPF